MFIWIAVDNCPSESVVYLISTTGDCFACPNFTTTASANCTTTDLLLMNNIIRNCTFSVQSNVCGYISNLSDPILIILKGKFTVTIILNVYKCACSNVYT